MKKIGLLLSRDYKLLSVAAVLEVFETVNKFSAASEQAVPFDIYLLASEETIAQTKEALGYQLIAVTPDSPAAIQASLKDTKGAAITYTLLSDSQFNLSSAFGVAYYLDEKTSATYLNTYKLNLNKEASSGKVVLPVPAVYRRRTSSAPWNSVPLKSRMCRRKPAMIGVRGICCSWLSCWVAETARFQ